MKQALFAIAFLLLLPLGLLSQGQGDVWFMGDSLLLDFGSQPPAGSLGAGLKARTSSSSVSDKDGNLVLYSNGLLRDGNHAPVNGWPPPYPIYSSLHYGSQTILLLAINDSVYCHFNPALGPNLATSNLYYSKILVPQNGSPPIAYDRHRFLTDSVTFQVAATRHGNGEDWWVVAHKGASDTFISMHIREGNLVSRSFYQVGSVTLPSSFDHCPLTFSEDGSMLATTARFGLLELFDFDRCTGEISLFNSINKADTFTNGYFGVSFSPSGRYLYVSDGYYGIPIQGGSISKLHQYDLTVPNLLSSEVLIWQTPGGFDTTGTAIVRAMAGHKLGPDGKIYVGHASYQNTLSIFDSLGVIQQPDSPGVACDFRPKSFPLPPGSGRAFFPNIPNYRLGPLAAQVAEAGPDLEMCPGDSVRIGDPDTSGGRSVFAWWPQAGLSDPAAAQPMASPSATTTYYLMVTDTTVHADCAATEDSVTVHVIDTANPPVADAGEDRVICLGDSLVLGAPGVPGLFYEWSPAAWLDDPAGAMPVARPPASGWFSVVAWDTVAGGRWPCRSDRDSVYVKVELPLAHPAPGSQTFCIGEALEIGVDAEPLYSYEWLPRNGLEDFRRSRTRVRPEESVAYVLRVASDTALSENCRTRDFPVLLSADNCLLQNVLTPNGDGVNDVLDLGDFNAGVQLRIFDRWGRAIYTADNYLNDWDGDGLPVGVYYYVLSVGGEGGKEKTGHFSLLR